MSALAELTIFPLDKGESVSKYVAEAVKIIKASGLEYQLGPMGTCIEGDWARLIDCVKMCMDALTKHSNRVYMVLKVDYRSDKIGRIKGKVDSVKEYL